MCEMDRESWRTEELETKGLLIYSGLLGWDDVYSAGITIARTAKVKVSMQIFADGWFL